MASIIVISDIHGNLSALKDAWELIQQRPYEALFCLGDLAAFGPRPEECITFLRDVIRPTATILGNTDRYLIEEPWKKTTEGALGALKWTREQLSDASFKWLSELPSTFEQTVDGVEVELVHGGPGDDEFRIGPETDPAALKELFAERNQGLTFCGHTHVPFRVRVNKRHVVNVGSIGFPYDRDTRAAYARVIVGGGDVHSVEFHRVNFNNDAVIADLEAQNVPNREVAARRLRFAEQEFPTRVPS